MFWLKKPKISVVILVYRMQREAPRTLYSLSTAYQQGVKRGDYEVIVVENPSSEMLRSDQVKEFGRNFRHVVHPGDASSPAAALNFGASLARGQHLMLMIDGARILSPGILQRSMAAMQLYDRSVVATLAWHLGSDIQSRSIHEGYCQDVEDRLLESVDWRDDGYSLFEISSLAGSCRGNWFGPILESNCITVNCEHYAELGGFCEDFQTLGGGFVNLDFFHRAIADPSRQTILVLGEGTFHQFHGGVATNRKNDEQFPQYKEEYQRLRGEALAPPELQPVLFGHMPKVAKQFMRPALSTVGSIERKRIASIVPPVSTDDHAVPASPQSPKPEPRVLAVLGMHRSGTSCLAGTLMECGVYFGDVSRQNRYNVKGNNENQQIMNLQDRLLADNGGSWKSPPEYVLWNDDHRRIRDGIIEQYRNSGQPRWGFKDPRTVLTLTGWTEKLTNLQPIGIFRHPDAVAESLTRRNLFPREQGLELWYLYNRRLLAFQRHWRFPMIHFSNDSSDFCFQLRQLVEHLKFANAPQTFVFFEPDLRHCEPIVARKLPRRVEQLYQELCEVVREWRGCNQYSEQRKAA
jgi:glycosyltransferase involved in cell wall biosynthesis